MKNNIKKNGFNPDELVADMLNSSSAEIVVGPDGTIMTKNEAIKKDVDGTRLLKQRVWGSFNGNVEKLIAALKSKSSGNGARYDEIDEEVTDEEYEYECGDAEESRCSRGRAKEEKNGKSSAGRQPVEKPVEKENNRARGDKKTSNRQRTDENDVRSMLSSSSSEIVVGPDGTIMTKNEAIKNDVDGTKLLKQRVWGAPPAPEHCAGSALDCDYGYYSASDDTAASLNTIESNCIVGNGETVPQNSLSSNEVYEFDIEDCDNLFGDAPGENDILSISTRAPETARRTEIDHSGLEEFRASIGRTERTGINSIVTVFKEFIAPAKFFTSQKGFAPIKLEFDEESARYTQTVFKPSSSSIRGAYRPDALLDLGESADAVLKRNDKIIRKAVTGEDKVEIFICVRPGLEFARSFKVISTQPDSILLKEILVDIVTLSEDIFSRNKSILETVELKDKKAALIGLGSIGSATALELARSGLGNFTLIDLDRLSAANICRHACAVTEIGKFKSYAMRDRILKINPFARVTASISDFTEDLEYSTKLIYGCDLIIVTTDTLASRRTANYLGILLQIPVIFSGVFERAGGGRIFKFDPAAGGACLECHQIGTFEERPGAVTYSAARDPRDLTIQPGLSVDINLTAELTAKMAIEELRDDKNHAMPYSLIITKHYSPEDGVNEPVRFMCARGANIKKNPDCPVCGENSGIGGR